MKKLFFILLLSLSALTQANMCNQTKMRFIGGTDFYKNFLRSHNSIKQDYTFYYQKVDDVLEANIEKSCGNRKRSTARMEKQHLNLCKVTCADQANHFHRNVLKTKFFVKGKISSMTRECQSVCDMSFSCEDDALCRAGL